MRLFLEKKCLLFLVDKSIDQVIGVQCYADLDDDIDVLPDEESLVSAFASDEFLNVLKERARKHTPRAFAPDLITLLYKQ